MDPQPHPAFRMSLGMELQMTCEQVQVQRLISFEELCQRIYEQYKDWPRSAVLIPTLDGPRLEFFHVIPLSRLEEAWPTEKLAARWIHKTFVSDLLPPDYVRYAVVHLYHRERCGSGPARALTSGPPYYRALEIELSVARAELSLESYESYWEFRRSITRRGFFQRSSRILDRSRERIERLADLWENSGVRRGHLWRVEDFLDLQVPYAPIGPG